MEGLETRENFSEALLKSEVSHQDNEKVERAILHSLLSLLCHPVELA